MTATMEGAMFTTKAPPSGPPGGKNVSLTTPEEDEEIRKLFCYWNKRPDVRVQAVTFDEIDGGNNCRRCGKKVYPVEKIDVGAPYHRACFKCRECGRQLTLQSFQRDLTPGDHGGSVREVYCNLHVPRGGGTGLVDAQALGIKSAIDAQKHASRKVHRHVYPDHHFLPEYQQRGSGDWSSTGSGSDSRPDSGQWDERENTAAAARWEAAPSTSVREIVDRTNAALVQPIHPAEQGSTSGGGAPALALPAEPETAHPLPDAVPTFIGTVQRHSKADDSEETEEEEAGRRQALLRRQESASQRNSTIRRRSTLRSFQDFEKFGVFDAQSLLEKAQRQEENELYTQIEAERRALRGRLEESLRKERDLSVKELIAFFEANDISREDKEAALIKVEEYYCRRREAALRALLQHLAAEEQAAVARMVEKHSSEMIQLIRKKERLASQSQNPPATSRPTPELTQPTVVSPTVKETKPASRTTWSPAMTSTLTHGGRVERSSVSAFLPVPSKSDSKSGPTLQILPTQTITPEDLADVSPLTDHMNSVSLHEASTRWQGDNDVENEDDSVELLDISAIPEAEPPECPKDELYSNPEVFKEQDERAIKESKKDHKTFTDLVRQLSKRCQTELQKVRAIFRWITVKDLNRMKFDDRVDPDSPLGLLRGIKTGSETYHDLFRRLCSYAGLHCEIIEGYSKGAGYRPGGPIEGDTFRNQWTAAWVDGSWRFINCKWGARHVKATRDASLTYKCDEFYFLTDPEDHIYQHFPDDPVWQLLPEPVSLNDFMRLPLLKSPFFNSRLTLAHAYNAILEAHDGRTEITIRAAKSISLAAKLRTTNRDIPSEILAERTLLRRMGADNIITVNLPSPGVYFLDVFVTSKQDSRQMDNACAFQVRCSGISRDANVSFPQVGCFGRTPTFEECGLSEETPADPYIISEGSVPVTFALSKNVSLQTTLRRWDPRDHSMADYDNFVLFRQRTSHLAAFEVHLPRRGLFVFSLYVANPEDVKAPMVCLYRYLIDCQTPKLDAEPHPKASRRFKHCHLLEPLTGELPPQTEVTFKLESKRALAMIVVFNNKSHKLKQFGRLWQGSVFLDVPSGKAMVYARFDSDSGKFIPLLEYHISSKKKYASYMS